MLQNVKGLRDPKYEPGFDNYLSFESTIKLCLTKHTLISLKLTGIFFAMRDSRTVCVRDTVRPIDGILVRAVVVLRAEPVYVACKVNTNIFSLSISAFFK